MPGKEKELNRQALSEVENSPHRPSIDDDHDGHESSKLLQEDETSDTISRAYAETKTASIFSLRWPRRRRRTICGSLLLALLAIVIASGYFVYQVSPPDGQSPPWYPTPRGGTDKSWAESYSKATLLVQKMDLIEKVNITTGVGWASDLCVGNTGPAIRAGFPALCLQDGPLGIRFADHITAFPAGITVAATWNRDLMYRRGRTHGLEARLKGVNVLLGPAMGPMGRMPAGGRNWEGFGVDPVLQGVAASETIKGIQDEGVQATAKHLIGQEQEHFRQQYEWGTPHAISSNIDDRALHEIYLWPFAESVRAGVASIMCSYNQVNNSYACGNSKLINGILKDELGFQGYIQSDWLAKRSGVGSVLAGLDMDMPGDGMLWANADSLWGDKLTIATLNASVPMERLNDMVTRIVAAWYQVGQDKWPQPPEGGPNFSSWTNDEVGPVHFSSGENTTGVVNKFVDVQGIGKDFHGRLVKEIAVEGTVLVKNEGYLLPLSKRGPSDLPTGVKYNVGVFGEDAGPGKGENFCKDRGCNQGTLASGWGSGAVDFPYLVTPVQALQAEFDHKHVNITTHLTNDIPSPTTIANQDLCFVFVNSDSGEGMIKWKDVAGDRPDLEVQKGGNKLVQAVARDCGKGKGDVIVVVHAVGPTLLEQWIDLPNVKGVILANLPGQESGNALASVLFGDENPSGRLPYTVGKTLDDYGPGAKIKYLPDGLVPQQNFDEGLYIDYRHFDKQNIAPRFEFGFGLGYTTFTYSNLQLATLKPKSPLPDPRPPPSQDPPNYDGDIPDPQTALFPPDLHRVKNRIYPYIKDVKDVKKGPYPYPDGYNVTQPPSQAGGAPGGNPSLFTPHLQLTFDITNKGGRAGKDVAQVYVAFPTAGETNGGGEGVDFPVKVLRGFDKVHLESGETKSVQIALTRKDLSYWDVWRQNWVMPDGEFEILVGRSSRDVVLRGRW